MRIVRIKITIVLYFLITSIYFPRDFLLLYFIVHSSNTHNNQLLFLIFLCIAEFLIKINILINYNRFEYYLKIFEIFFKGIVHISIYSFPYLIEKMLTYLLKSYK